MQNLLRDLQESVWMLQTSIPAQMAEYQLGLNPR